MKTGLMLFRLLFLSLLFGQGIQAQEEKAALPKGYREVGSDKETALRELCLATAETGLFSGAVLVAEGGKVIYKEGFGKANREWDIPNSADTRFRIASVSKQFCSMLVMQLVQEGKVKLDVEFPKALFIGTPKTIKSPNLDLKYKPPVLMIPEGTQNVALYFYPRAMTPGCTVQACGIRDSKKALAALDTVVLGVSPDPVARLGRFIEKQDLNFTLLSDEDHAITEKYGAWGLKKSPPAITYVPIQLMEKVAC